MPSFRGLLRALRAWRHRSEWLQTEPLATWVPRAYSKRNLPVGTRLTRIYDRDGAQRNSYSALDFNPTPVHPDDANNRGRFSSTRANQYAYMYVAEGKQGLRVAIWETIGFHGIVRTSQEYLLPSRIFKGRAVRYMQTTRPLFIVNIRNQTDVVDMRADITAIQGSDQRVTRAWAHYIRRVIPRTEGLRYKSNKHGEQNALVLFEDLPHITQKTSKSRPRSVRPIGNPISLDNPAGHRLIRDAMRPTPVKVQ